MSVKLVFSQMEESEKLELPTKLDAIKRRGLYYRVHAQDKIAALKRTVELLHLPEKVGKNFLTQLLCAREEIASPGVGDGIVIPHVRNSRCF